MLPTQISNNASLITNMLELIYLQNSSPTRLHKETSTAALEKKNNKKKTATKFYSALMLKEALNTKIPLPSQD